MEKQIGIRKRSLVCMKYHKQKQSKIVDTSLNANQLTIQTTNYFMVLKWMNWQIKSDRLQIEIPGDIHSNVWHHVQGYDRGVCTVHQKTSITQLQLGWDTPENEAVNTSVASYPPKNKTYSTFQSLDTLQLVHKYQDKKGFELEYLRFSS